MLQVEHTSEQWLLMDDRILPSEGVGIPERRARPSEVARTAD